MKNCFFVIDPQNDLCHSDGSIYVPGADRQMKTLSEFISDNKEKIDNSAKIIK